ncbi:hypothetical protein F5B17DRAFT_447552 [Nemania serpens]|nr:hypothetical protein F5B17DRAFT_447552 [Nemania serpens]
MNNGESIISWTQGLPEYMTSRPTGLTKRKLVHQEQRLASPPASLKPSDENNIASTPKRRRLEALLRLAGELETKALNIDRFPKVAGSDDVLESMVEIGRGLNILPYRMKSAIEKVMGLGELVTQWRTTFQSPEVVDDLPGCIPSFEEVDGVVRWAELCQEDECEEAAWNHDVHLALLRKVFGDAEQKINAMLCTTARPSKYFKPAASTGQLIDMLLNHTDYNPLRTRPLLLSIETEKPDTGNSKAQLQIGVWYSTQWSFLRWAVGQRLKKRARLEADETTTEVETDTLACLSKLGFIPGIVVRGHRWCLVLSTYDGKKTTIWEEHQFGTTSSSFGAFCAIAGIRRLTAWAMDCYWPWFEKNILD